MSSKEYLQSKKLWSFVLNAAEIINQLSELCFVCLYYCEHLYLLPFGRSAVVCHSQVWSDVRKPTVKHFFYFQYNAEEAPATRDRETEDEDVLRYTRTHCCQYFHIIQLMYRWHCAAMCQWLQDRRRHLQLVNIKIHNAGFKDITISFMNVL